MATTETRGLIAMTNPVVMFHIRREQGRVAETVEWLQDAARQHVVVHSMLVHAYAEIADGRAGTELRVTRTCAARRPSQPFVVRRVAEPLAWPLLCSTTPSRPRRSTRLVLRTRGRSSS